MISICSWLVLPLVEQELLTLPEHLSSPPVFSGIKYKRTNNDLQNIHIKLKIEYQKPH
jgi:hypothetical protein